MKKLSLPKTAIIAATALVAVTGVAAAGNWLWQTRPKTYLHDGLKYVEYHRGRYKGMTCSYFPHDNWRQWTLFCGDTDKILGVSNYRQPTP